jgi:DNA-binding transcriptional MocR family regulator
MATKYRRLATALERQISDGTYAIGSRLPSLRTLRARHRVSLSTVLQAYASLERKGLVRARERSGFFVTRPARHRSAAPAVAMPASSAASVSVDEVLAELEGAGSGTTPALLGDALLDPATLPARWINRAIRRALQHHADHAAHYHIGAATNRLTAQLARRSLDRGCSLSAKDFVITSGATQAISLALSAVAQRGDTVAVETPCFFGFLRTLDALGIKAIEVPADPTTGLDLDILARLLRRRRISACYTIPTGHNPLGFVMPETHRQQLARLATQHGIAVIEDDVMGELIFGTDAPRAVKAFDEDGRVMLCSSLSKTVGPGLRIGWVHPGRYASRVIKLKATLTGDVSPLLQLTAAELLEHRYDRRMRQLRAVVEDRVNSMHDAIAEYFPRGTRISRPRAGLVLWVELPPGIDAMQLYRLARRSPAAIFPGPLFSVRGAYRNCIRINAGYPWSDRLDRALRTLARLCPQARGPSP